MSLPAGDGFPSSVGAAAAAAVASASARPGGGSRPMGHTRSQSYSFSTQSTPPMPIGPLTFGIGPSYGGVFAPLNQSGITLTGTSPGAASATSSLSALAVGAPPTGIPIRASTPSSMGSGGGAVGAVGDPIVPGVSRTPPVESFMSSAATAAAIAAGVAAATGRPGRPTHARSQSYSFSYHLHQQQQQQQQHQPPPLVPQQQQQQQPPVHFGAPPPLAPPPPQVPPGAHVMGPLSFGMASQYGAVFAPLSRTPPPPPPTAPSPPVPSAATAPAMALSMHMLSVPPADPDPAAPRPRPTHHRSLSASESRRPFLPLGSGSGPASSSAAAAPAVTAATTAAAVSGSSGAGGPFAPVAAAGPAGAAGSLSSSSAAASAAASAAGGGAAGNLAAAPVCPGAGSSAPSAAGSSSATAERSAVPSAQAWLDRAKAAEERGDFAGSLAVLRQALLCCPPAANEGLMIRALRCAERLGRVDVARALLAVVQSEPVPRVWRALLEGANVEARAGNLDSARSMFQHLMRHLPTYGPVFHDAMRTEERAGNLERAVSIAERGLAAVAVPRYGPLWFAALRVFERLSYSAACAVAARAVSNIWRELQWKVYFELGQIHQRAGSLHDAREAMARAALACPAHLLWKVWLGGARLEAWCGELGRARLLLARAAQEAPSKARATVRIEQARLEEYGGDVQRARGVLAAAMHECRSEKKVFLEAVMLEMRAGDNAAAVKVAWQALQAHRGTGRLWAVLIQLMHMHGEEAQLRVLRAAQEEVPRSGEVWCEGARIFMHPRSRHFSLETARRFLEWAIQFTPQYGDSFLEMLRLQLLLGATPDELSRLEQLCIHAEPNYGPMWFYCRKHPLDTPRDILRTARLLLQQELFLVRDLYARAIARSLGPSAASPVDNESHAAVSDADFTTGLIALSRLPRRPRTDTERWTHIFGGDVIAP